MIIVSRLTKDWGATRAIWVTRAGGVALTEPRAPARSRRQTRFRPTFLPRDRAYSHLDQTATADHLGQPRSSLTVPGVDLTGGCLRFTLGYAEAASVSSVP